MEDNEWISQVRRGIVEFCILALISKKPTYGYEIVVSLQKWQHLAITEGALYPLLRRLQKERHLESFWQESASGPPRKYYRLTQEGHLLLHSMSATWAELAKSISELLQYREDEKDGQKDIYKNTQ